MRLSNKLIYPACNNNYYTELVNFFEVHCKKAFPVCTHAKIRILVLERGDSD
jgi:hypothetical protein